LLEAIQWLQRADGKGINQVCESIVLPDIGMPDENIEVYDPTSPLLKEPQQHPWPYNYKPHILPFDRKANPRKFKAS
jgi:hypothetical protein